MATEHVERRIEITATTNGVDQAAQKLSNLASAHKGVAGAAEETNVTLDSLDRRLNAIQRRFDQNYRAQKDFEKVERELNTLRKAERITEERRVQLLGMAEAQLKKNTTAQTAFITSTRQLQQANDNAARVAKQTYALHAGQIASLRSQAVDVGTMLALGANPFRSSRHRAVRSMRPLRGQRASPARSRRSQAARWLWSRPLPWRSPVLPPPSASRPTRPCATTPSRRKSSVR